MSHVTRVELRIKDIDALAAGGSYLGLELVRDQQTFRTFQSGIRCDHLLRQVDRDQPDYAGKGYEVGIVKREDGEGYDLLFDAYDPALAGKVGEDAVTLRNEYAAAVATKIYEEQGYFVTRSNANGEIYLDASR